MSNINEAEIEALARKLCIEDGKDPNQLIGLSFRAPHPMLWKRYRGKAIEMLSKDRK